MDWKTLLTSKRFGLEGMSNERNKDRTEYQRDYDRLIFSSPFRRLQNKTQVFPLPGSVFVHNRLTHSIEVSCVGRSLGMGAGRMLKEKHVGMDADFDEMGSIVAAACLAHDLGNPPFGHSGEKAISTYFSEGKGAVLEKSIKDENGRWEDFTNFEGNANSIRLLMHQFAGRRKGGFVLTYSTLASIAKYPYSSLASTKKNKFGFFQSEEDSFRIIADELGLLKLHESPLKYARHPLVFLVEAADDICYQVMDLEDAHKLRIISTEKIKELLLGFFPEERQLKIRKTMEIVDDVNEQIAYLRSSVIGVLINECIRVFVDNEDEILSGKFEDSLIDKISSIPCEAYKACKKFSIDNIYRSKDVLDIELAGHRIISFLLDILINAVQKPDESYSKLLLNRVPEQYEVNDKKLYTRILAVLDYISGMTDVYALDLYRKITGMSLPAV
ncbi:deoxyguanosinetriphosphate triphosphohydrolase [Dysgonomonas sp. 216]|nr:deoxyguanosinetriphosphate triphosphohydrolase [Dysgonomonas sp. 216]